MPEQQRRSVAVVSGGTTTLAPIAGYLDLPSLDDLSRLVEAYILHDESFYLEDGAVLGTLAEVIENLDEGLLISSRYNFHSDEGEKLSPLLKPFVDEKTVNAREDLERVGGFCVESDLTHDLFLAGKGQ